MTINFSIFLLPNENKDKKYLHYWISGFFGSGSGFTRNPFIFRGFLFLETIPTQLPDPTHF